MPIYEYECEQCGHHLEALQKFSDPPLNDCPECSRPGLRKLVSAAGFVLKGTGWYATDFRDSGKAGAKDKKDKANGGEGAAESSKPEAAPKAGAPESDTAKKSTSGESTTKAKPASDSST
jgi:putative FmdB family regulatory protein